ncbi:MAG: hydroxymethylbilane synthase [Nitrospirae bacterium]|nr:hydroxymethylbilane synthase [Nitrospirota bacterium]
MTPSTVLIGTRGSTLALTQSRALIERIQAKFPHIRFELKVIKTQSDRMPDVPLSEFGGKGLFIKEIEEALLRHEIALGIHSLKDMTAETTAGLGILGVTEREDPRDCVISYGRRLFRDLPKGARVGTSSLRRTLLAHALRPDVQYVPLRGNVDTRIRKAASGEVDAVILAFAALKRLGRQDEATEWFDPETFIPAAGQGRLAVEGRVGDPDALAWAKAVDDPSEHLCWKAEQAFLLRLEGGCKIPLGSHAILRDGRIFLRVVKGTQIGEPLYRAEGWGSADEPEALGIRLAEDVLRQEPSRLSLDGGYRGLASIAGKPRG